MTPQAIDLTEAALSDMTERMSKALLAHATQNAPKYMFADTDTLDSFSYNTQGRNIYGGYTREES
jgi:hypothetical protein